MAKEVVEGRRKERERNEGYGGRIALKKICSAHETHLNSPLRDARVSASDFPVE
jgi:hypothetical protein